MSWGKSIAWSTKLNLWIRFLFPFFNFILLFLFFNFWFWLLFSWLLLPFFCWLFTFSFFWFRIFLFFFLFGWWSSCDWWCLNRDFLLFSPLLNKFNFIQTCNIVNVIANSHGERVIFCFFINCSFSDTILGNLIWKTWH